MNGILVASDNEQALDAVRSGFDGHSSVRTAKDSQHYAALLDQCGNSHHRFELIFIDLDFLRKPDQNTSYRDFHKTLQPLWEKHPGAEVIVMCSQQKIREAVMAVKAGAADYLTYPVDPLEVKHLVDIIEEQRRRQVELDYLRSRVRHPGMPDLLDTSSPLMKKAIELVNSVAPTRTTVILYGETGTGKSVTARLIHSLSNRSNGPFISIHCGAVPETLIESDLFGHERGAFTGADRRKLGKFEVAKGGTIFLDEVGTVGPSVQIKLLQALQDHTFQRLGGETTIEADVRVIAATNENLLELTRQGKFRMDLYYRLNVFSIELPPLRDRVEDLPVLVEEFLRRLNQVYGKNIVDVEPRVLEAFRNYSWPGNIREVENLLERAYILENSSTLTFEHLPTQLFAAPSLMRCDPATESPTLDQVRRKGVEIIERQYLRDVLTLNRGRMDKSAETAGITPRQLRNLIAKHGLRKNDFK